MQNKKIYINKNTKQTYYDLVLYYKSIVTSMNRGCWKKEKTNLIIIRKLICKFS